VNGWKVTFTWPGSQTSPRVERPGDSKRFAVTVRNESYNGAISAGIHHVRLFLRIGYRACDRTEI